MHSLAPISKLLLCSFPCRLYDLGISEFVEDTIASQHDEIIIVLNLETLDIRRSNYNFRIALILGSFGLNITKGSRHGESSREHSVGTQ